MKQKLFIFLLLVITAVGVKAQSSLWLESGDIPGNNSIIRSGGSNIVLYGESSPTQGFLTLMPSGVGISLSASLLPGFQVTDFRIDGDDLYFIGQLSSTCFIGRLNIPNVFFGGGQIDYYPLSMVTTMPVSLMFNTINRLKLYRDDSEKLHLLITGIATEMYGSDGVPIGYIIELDDDFVCYRYYIGENDEFFEDVVVTDNTIVAIARKGNDITHGPLLARIFDRHAANPFTTAVCKYFTVEHRAAKSTYRVTHIGGDDFALAYVWGDGTDLTTSIDVFQSTLMPSMSYLYGIQIPQGTGSQPNWDVVDIGYDQSSQILSLLETVNGSGPMPGSTYLSEVYEVNISSPTAISGRTLTGFVYEGLTSLSLHGSNQYVCSGFNSMLGIYFQSPGGAVCSNEIPLIFNMEILEKAEGTRCFHTGMVPLTPVSLTPTITNSKTHPICNQK